MAVIDDSARTLFPSSVKSNSCPVFFVFFCFLSFLQYLRELGKLVDRPSARWPVVGGRLPVPPVGLTSAEQTASSSSKGRQSPQFIISFPLLGSHSLALVASQFLDLGQGDGRLEIQTGQFAFLDLVRQVSAVFLVAVVLDVTTAAGVWKSVGISHGFGSLGEIIRARNHQTRSAQQALIPPQTDKWVHLTVQDPSDRYWCVKPRHDGAAKGFHRRNRRLRSSRHHNVNGCFEFRGSISE